MSQGRRTVARVAMIGGGLGLLGALGALAIEHGEVREPASSAERRRDAGEPAPDAGKDAEVGPVLSRLDGAVQLHLPMYEGTGGELISPEELRVRRREQIELIEARMAELEEELAAQPGATVLEQRLAQLRARRDTLRALLDEP